jgi:hypothetical protein
MAYDPTEADWPGVLYSVGDELVATVVTTGAGGSTGLLVVQFVGFGFGDAVHNAVKV